MAKVLILAYAFPPIPYSGTYRILRLCKGLDALNHEVHVLTINIDGKIPNDFELVERLPEKIQVHRSPIPDPWLWFQSWKNKKKRNSRLSIAFTRVLNVFFNGINIPDHQVLWVPIAVSRAAKIVKKHDIHTILVSAPPYSILLCGSILKRMKGVRFIADLRDPIVGNVAQVSLLRPKGIYSKFMRKVHEKLEKHNMKKADVVITNTATHEKELEEKYKRANIATVRNSFDPDDYRDLPKAGFDKFTIAHMGAMYGLRKADVLFEAIKQIEQRSADGGPNLQVLFVGSVSEEIKHAVDAYNVRPYVRFLGRVPHRRAIELMLCANLLLLVKATGNNSLGQIPAKFFEYLGTGTPILCIGPAQSEVAGLIRDYNFGYVVENDVSRMVEIIESLIRRNENYSTEESISSKLTEFDNFTMAKKVSEFIRWES